MSHVIPKRKAAVRIRFTTGEVVDGSVFLDYIDPIHRGEQTLLDKFNNDSPWLPLATNDGVEMVNRARARGYKWIDLSLTAEDNPATPVLAERMGGKIYKRYRAYRYPF